MKWNHSQNFKLAWFPQQKCFYPLVLETSHSEKTKKNHKKPVGTSFNLTLFLIAIYFSDPGWLQIKIHPQTHTDWFKLHPIQLFVNIFASIMLRGFFPQLKILASPVFKNMSLKIKTPAPDICSGVDVCSVFVRWEHELFSAGALELRWEESIHPLLVKAGETKLRRWNIFLCDCYTWKCI